MDNDFKRTVFNVLKREDDFSLKNDKGETLCINQETKNLFDKSIMIEEGIYFYNDNYYITKERSVTLYGETYIVESFINVTMYYSKLDAWKEKCQELKMENEDLKVDRVTSLPTRLELDKYIEQINNNGQYKIFVMCDIDDFKRINDNYGHQVGDLVLNRFGSIFKNNIRQEDFVGRYGGEEFLFVFNTDDLEIILRRLYSIRQSIKSAQELIDKGLNNITFSAGISICSPKLNPHEAIDNADKALYQVKNNGKNGEAVFDRKMGTSYMVKRGIIESLIKREQIVIKR